MSFFVILSPGASARLGIRETETSIHIDGVNYGRLSKVKTFADLQFTQNSGEDFSRVSLGRDFVTEPSLYHWARKNAQARDQLNHISIVTQTTDGYEVSRYDLKNCKPLSWTVETADPSQGGFHETVVLAVQEFAVY
ncbi:MAG: phage tail protein [Deltaproteobacteria bacterium]|nr:phage tail protein [Deltaproteobacteria bacterium]